MQLCEHHKHIIEILKQWGIIRYSSISKTKKLNFALVTASSEIEKCDFNRHRGISHWNTRPWQRCSDYGLSSIAFRCLYLHFFGEFIVLVTLADRTVLYPCVVPQMTTKTNRETFNYDFLPSWLTLYALVLLDSSSCNGRNVQSIIMTVPIEQLEN